MASGSKEKPLDVSRMGPEEARWHLDERLEVSQTSFARAIGVNASTLRKWLKVTEGGYSTDIPMPIAILLRLLTPDQVRRLIEAHAKQQRKEDSA
ncbi:MULTISPECIES: hypothetical protein [unclassified Bradyrhizobium]|uniref:hypothetical protein n=1 Tax=unclassified Bradyrhizobium TaxID=2631580 RepID=UPI002916E4E8|nr:MULTISPECIES: hypothetical protein [unclassified Bradyrhizobium]